jgi:hypothetical protein
MTSFTTNVDGGTGDGGAVYGNGTGGLTVDSTSFTGNDAVYGGGIYWNSASAVKVTNSTFTNNAGAWEYAGAIYDNSSTSMTLNSDRFIGNVGGYAGALYLNSSVSTYTLNQDEFDNNSASYDGGAVLWVAGSLSSMGSSFVGNAAGRDGGAISIGTSDPPTFNLVNATISGNTASYGGGIWFGVAMPTTMTNDTIAYNTAGAGQGGGIYSPQSATTGGGTAGVMNTIVASNAGGDCGSGGPASFSVVVDQGNNMDSDKSCFEGDGGPLNASDNPGVNPMLGHPADNGGLVLTDSDLGSPAIDAGANSSKDLSNNCPSTDARGITRPKTASDKCDVGAYEAAAANLSISKSAPSSVAVGAPFEYTVTVSDGGPASSTGTSLVDGLPLGETLWSVTPSQGTCSMTNSQVTCNLGKIDKGASATVTMVVSEANAGSVTNTATVANDEGSSTSGSATTNVTAPGSNTITTPPIKVTGSLVLVSTSLSVSNGKVSVKFMCKSNVTCIGTFTIEKRVKVAHTSAFGPLVCTKPLTTAYRIPAGATQTIKAGVTPGCLKLLDNAKNQTITGKLSSGPRSGQAGVIKKVTMHNA